MSQYFPTPSSHKENIKVEIDLSNYGTETCRYFKRSIKN